MLRLDLRTGRSGAEHVATRPILGEGTVRQPCLRFLLVSVSRFPNVSTRLDADLPPRLLESFYNGPGFPEARGLMKHGLRSRVWSSVRQTPALFRKSSGRHPRLSSVSTAAIVSHAPLFPSLHRSSLHRCPRQCMAHAWAEDCYCWNVVLPAFALHGASPFTDALHGETAVMVSVPTKSGDWQRYLSCSCRQSVYGDFVRTPRQPYFFWSLGRDFVKSLLISC
jgi:hypothetical protein